MSRSSHSGAGQSGMSQLPGSQSQHSQSQSQQQQQQQQSMSTNSQIQQQQQQSRYWQQQRVGTTPVYMRRPKVIVFDILGTASKSGFLERILFPYLKVNLEPYLNTHWEKKDFAKLYRRILDNSIDLNRADPQCPVVGPLDRADAKESLIEFINFVTEHGIASAPVTQLRFKVWFEGYQSSRLKTPIYSDVASKMRQWFSEGVKFYVFSNCWVEAQQALLRNTNHGDLTNLIAGHYDNDFGSLAISDSWRRLCTQIKQSPNDVLFLTKSPAEAAAALEVGVCAVLVLTHRHNVRAISHDDRQRFPYVRTLLDLLWLESSQVGGGTTPIVGVSSTAAGGGGGLNQVDTMRTSLADQQLSGGGGSSRNRPGSGAYPTAPTVVAPSTATAASTTAVTVSSAPTTDSTKQHSGGSQKGRQQQQQSSHRSTSGGGPNSSH